MGKIRRGVQQKPSLNLTHHHLFFSKHLPPFKIPRKGHSRPKNSSSLNILVSSHHVCPCPKIHHPTPCPLSPASHKPLHIPFQRPRSLPIRFSPAVPLQDPSSCHSRRPILLHPHRIQGEQPRPSRQEQLPLLPLHTEPDGSSHHPGQGQQSRSTACAGHSSR